MFNWECFLIMFEWCVVGEGVSFVYWGEAILEWMFSERGYRVNVVEVCYLCFWLDIGWLSLLGE